MDDNTKKGLIAVGGAGALVMVWRKMRQSRSATTAGGTTTLTSAYGGGVQPYTPQSPLTVSPGDSVYDPNTEGLYTTPIGLSTGPEQVPPGTSVLSGGSLLTAPSPPPPQTAAPSAPGYTVNVNYPPTTTKKPNTKAPAKRPSYAPAGAKHTGPKSPGPGWRGIGGGWWAPPKKGKK